MERQIISSCGHCWFCYNGQCNYYGKCYYTKKWSNVLQNFVPTTYVEPETNSNDYNELCELQRVSIAESFVRENQLKDRIYELEKENKNERDFV